MYPVDAGIGSLIDAIMSVGVFFLLPIFLFALWWELRLLYKRSEFIKKMEWEFLEIRISQNIIKTPQSMESVFANLYGIYSFGIKFLDKYLDGKVDRWLSFEMMGRDGGVSFYVRCTKGDRHLVESAIYSHYPEVEIIPATDYTARFPSVLPNDTYDLFGANYVLTKDNAYPIKTYLEFENPKDEKRVDLLASLTEALSKLKADEVAWIQLLVSPTGAPSGNDLKKQGDELIKKIIEERSPKRFDKEGVAIPSFGTFALTRGDQEVIKAIEEKTAKLPFQITLRFLYMDKKETFSPNNVAAVMGSFQQFNTRNMNGFKPEPTVFGGFTARLFPWYKKVRVFAKKRRFYDYYVQRRFGYSGRLRDEKLPVLNIEELATIFHFPSLVVKAPKLHTLPSRKGSPPVNLPID
ncbi:MAG: hypothetical protein WC246_02920 [Candidatus Paceibacterota bacterium]|jgi:hypothetical protein